MNQDLIRSPWVATGWENMVVNDCDGYTLALAPGPTKEMAKARSGYYSANGAAKTSWRFSHEPR